MEQVLTGSGSAFPCNKISFCEGLTSAFALRIKRSVSAFRKNPRAAGANLTNPAFPAPYKSLRFMGYPRFAETQFRVRIPSGSQTALFQHVMDCTRLLPHIPCFCKTPGFLLRNGRKCTAFQPHALSPRPLLRGRALCQSRVFSYPPKHEGLSGQDIAAHCRTDCFPQKQSL